MDAAKSSYTYWVREATQQAAPAPVPHKLTAQELALNIHQTHLGSAWNQAGTWEERSIHSWAAKRLEELLMSIEPLEFADGSAAVTNVACCKGDATVVTVRNKKRVGYSYEITLDVKGELLFGEFKDLVGSLSIADACFGELDDLQLAVSIVQDGGLPEAEKSRLSNELRNFLPRIREKMFVFEEELKMR